MQLDLRTKKQMKSIARQVVGSHLAHQTTEAATQQRQPERVLNGGSAGDSPAPVGDSPTGTAPSHVAKRRFSLPRTLVSVPAGGSPDGTGGTPVLPETIFQTRSQEGVIRPTLTVGEARDLFARFHGVTSRPRNTRFRERLRRLAEYFAANLADLSAEDMDLAEAQLTRIIEQIGARKLLALSPRPLAS